MRGFHCAYCDVRTEYLHKKLINFSLQMVLDTLGVETVVLQNNQYRLRPCSCNNDNFFTNLFIFYANVFQLFGWGDNQRLPKMHFLWLAIRTVCLLFSLKNYTYKRRGHPSDSFLFYPEDGVRIFFRNCKCNMSEDIPHLIHAWLSTYFLPSLPSNKTY